MRVVARGHNDQSGYRHPILYVNAKDIESLDEHLVAIRKTYYFSCRGRLSWRPLSYQVKFAMSPIGTSRRLARGAATGPELRQGRKWLADRQSEAIDPLAT